MNESIKFGEFHYHWKIILFDFLLKVKPTLSVNFNQNPASIQKTVFENR